MPGRRNNLAALAMLAAGVLVTTPALAQKKYDPGASDTEVKIGNIMPYSGPASSYGVIGKTEAAFFRMINDQGGINGRKINFISYDDAYSPPKAIETLRRSKGLDVVLLVASDGMVQAAWHGGERDSGRFTGWLAKWKSSAPQIIAE